MRSLLLACVAGAALLAPLASRAQTLHVALREDADMLDPTLARSFVGRIVFAGLCDKLFDIDEKLAIVPQLATGYEWVNPTTLILHLREGVTFQDGEGMDADSVVYSLQRHLTMPGSFRRSEIGAMDHAEAVDPHTVRVVLKRPSAPFVAQLADRAGMIVAPEAARKAGANFAQHPVCAGPFSFVERSAQDHITLQRFPGYWDAKDIHVDRVVYQVLVDSSVRLANLQAGTSEVVENIQPTDVAAVKADPKLRVVTSDALGYQGITINTAHGSRAQTPFGQDARVRQAFALSLDRAALNQVVYNGMYVPNAQGLPPESPYYDAAIKPAARDVDAAKALLKQAGVTTPVRVDLIAPTSPDIQQVAQVIQSMAGEAGFDVHITAMEFASSLNAGQAGDFQAYLLAWSGRVDPDGNLYGFLHTGGAQNYGGYANPAVDKALDDADLTIDPAARHALYDQAQAQVLKDVPILYLWTPRNIAGMSARVQGFRAVPDGMIRLQGLSLAGKYAMRGGLLPRVLQVVPTLLLVSVLVFLLQQLMPGDPALVMAGENGNDPVLIAQLHAQLGLDRPIVVQDARWLWAALHGDLGTSWRTHEAIASLVAQKLPVTLQLSAMAFVIAVLIGVPAGVLSAARRDTWLDWAANGVGLAGLSTPNFWLGIMLILLVSVHLGWLPPSGYVPLTEDPWRSLATTIMPAFVLGNAIAAVLMRHTRSAMLTALDQDYVRTARAKGLRESSVVLRHALRNALVPVITLGALELGTLLSGAVLTEQVFSIPGFGKLVVDAVFNRDYPVVQGVVLVTGCLFVLLNLLADLLYVLANPRLRSA